jgi:DNA-binding transcriptional LysR family regulator
MVEPVQEALVVRKLGSISIGLYAQESYLAAAGTPASIEDLADHSLVGFDEETASIRAMRSRLPQFESLHFALRANSDFAQLQAIRAGFGIGFCQVGIARRDPHFVRLLPGAFDLKLGVWLAMHENLRTTPRCRAAFDGLAAGLAEYIAKAA